MSSELTPTGSNPRMTKAQIRKYLRDMQAAQKAAKEKIKASEEEKERKKEIQTLETKLKNVF